MSTDLARRAFAAFNDRNVEAMLELMHPEVEFWVPTAEFARGGEPYRGHEGIRQYFEDVGRVWEELEVIPREFREVEGAVITFGRVYGRGEGGYISDSPAQWVFRTRDGLIFWGRVFTSRSAALAAVGLGR